MRSLAVDDVLSRVLRREVTVLLRVLLAAEGREEVDIPPTTDGLAEVGIEGGGCRSPIAETLFRRFFSAPKAEDCGSSISRP